MNETADKKCSFHREASTCPRQWLYLLGSEGVVYSEAQNRFAGLDAAGVAAYRAFDAGASVEDLRKVNHVNRTSLAPNDGLDAVYAVSQGIFADEEPRQGWPALNRPRTANVKIQGIPVLLEYPLGPMEDLCRDYFLNCPATKQPARFHLSMRHERDGWAIDINDHEILSSLREEQVGLGLLHAARSLLYAEEEYDVAFHAAMVSDRDCGVMLCAPREAGKSTLAAYLMAHGFELLTDEPALLQLDTGSITSLPFPISLKEGSLSILEHDWPQLSSAPVHMRSDGVKIRLLHSPQASFSAHSRKLTHIIFPHYSSTSVATHTERLSPLRTLSLLNEGGMLLGKYFDQPKLESFLRFICATPAYTIQYASLETAMQMIHELSHTAI